MSTTKTPYDVILKPVISERSMDDVQERKYTFKVAKAANKTQVKQAVEEIDIGDPCLIRAAAKNFHSILVLPGTEWYEEAVEEMKANNNCVSLPFRQRMASRAFDATSRYDALITSYIRP